MVSVKCFLNLTSVMTDLLHETEGEWLSGKKDGLQLARPEFKSGF